MIRINDKEFNMLVEYFKENFGINLSKKRTLIESRLNNYLIKKGYSDFKSYFDNALNDKSGMELSQIVNFLTTNFSYFMREWDHFKFFRDSVLPEITSGIRGNDLRTWSAGCSTGEEPYTLAMLISDYFSDKSAKWDAKVLATDISEKALKKAKEGSYEEESLKNVPTLWKFGYFSKTPDGTWKTKDKLRQEVVFRKFNLIEEHFPFKKKFHVIFCRNVMIYFDDGPKRKLIEKFYNSLDDGGYLFIGQSESINREDTKFKYIKPSIYKKVV